MSGSRRSRVVVGMWDLIGHWRVSPIALLIYGLSSVVGAFIVLGSQRGEVATVSLVAVAATAVAILVVLLGSAGASVARRGRPPGDWFLAIAVVAGAARAGVLVVLAEAWLGEAVEGVPALVVSSSLSAVVWLGLAGLLVAGHDRYRAHYRSLVAGQGGIVWQDDYWDQHPDVTRLKSSIRGAVECADASPDPDQLARASAAIREEIEETLRPLSHRLWFGTSDEEPHVRWSQVVVDAVRGCTVPVLPMTLMWLAGSIVGGIALLGATTGVLAAAISSALLLTCLLGVAPMVHRRPSITRSLVALTLLAAIPVLGTDAILRTVGVPSSLAASPSLAALLVLALAGLLVLVASVSLAWADRRTVLEVASRQRGTREVSGLDSARVSEYLHNTLQSELTGLAMQLEAAARQGDRAEGMRTLVRVQALLNRSIAEELSMAEEPPGVRARRVAAAWTGICEVDMRIDPDIEAGRSLREATSAAEELIANAVRHSGATRVLVTIDHDPAGVAVTCRTNTPGARATGEGLGTHLLDRVAAAGVDVVPVDGGTLYRLVVD